MEPGVCRLSFSWFFCLLFWGGRAAATGNSGLNLTLFCKGEIQEGTRSREMRGWPGIRHSQKGIWHHPRGIWSRKMRAPSDIIRDWNIDWNCVSSTSVFPIRTATPVSSSQKIEQPSPPESEPTFSVWSRRRRSGNLGEEIVVSTLSSWLAWRPHSFSDQANSQAGWLMFLPYWLLTLYFFPTWRTPSAFSTAQLLHGLTDVPALHSTTWLLSRRLNYLENMRFLHGGCRGVSRGSAGGEKEVVRVF